MTDNVINLPLSEPELSTVRQALDGFDDAIRAVHWAASRLERVPRYSRLARKLREDGNAYSELRRLLAQRSGLMP